MKNIRWKKGLFQCAYKINEGEEQIGELKQSKFTLSATGSIGEDRYRFKVIEGLKNRVEIINSASGEKLGTIRFSHWLPKATIEYKGEIYKWRFSNLWETRWQIADAAQNTQQYKGWTCSGSIASPMQANIMTLTGLFISNYFWQMSAIYAAIFIPFFTVFMV
jgi:hypothetical protein